MSYTLTFDDNFQRADTALGATANSTNVGNGWIDFVGNLWNIQGNVLSNTRVNSPGPNLPLNCLYRSPSEYAVNGRIRSFSDPSGAGAIGCVARFTPENGGSGYGAMIYQGGQWFIYKAVNGVQGSVIGAVPITGSCPTNYGIEMTVQQVDSSTTQITLNLFDVASPDVSTATYSVTDTTPELQNASGSLCIGAYSGSTWSRAQTFVPSATLSSGVSSVGKVFKSVVNVTASAASGGTGSVSYQWYRSTVSGQLGTAISGATSVSLTDTGRSPNTTYYYTLIATDQATPTPSAVTYTAVSATTLPVGGFVFGYIGDSITFGTGSSSMSAADTETSLLNTAGYHVQNTNAGVGGSTTAGWMPSSGGLLETAVDQFNAVEVDTVSIMLGTNDAKNGSGQVSAATFKSNLQAIITALFAQISTLTRVVLNYQPYVVPGALGAWDASSNTVLQTYQPQIDSLINGTTIVAGDKTAFSHFQANQGELSDGVHPNQTGHTFLGTAWATAFEAALAAEVNSSSSSSSSTHSSGSSDSSSHSSLSSQSSASSSSSSSHGHSESSSSSSSGLLVSDGTISADIYFAIAQFYAEAYEGQIALIMNFDAAVERLRCQEDVNVTLALLGPLQDAASLAAANLQDVGGFLPAVRSIQQHVAKTSGLTVAEWIAEAVDGGKIPYAWALLSKQVGFDIDSVIDWTTESSSSSSTS